MAKVSDLPARPWVTGKNAEYTCFHLKVIILEKNGGVLSDHEPESDLDREIAMTLNSGGLQQSAFAMLSESMRLQSRYAILSKITDDPEFMKKIDQESDPKEISELEKFIANAVNQYFMDILGKNTISVIRECFEDIRKNPPKTD